MRTQLIKIIPSWNLKRAFFSVPFEFLIKIKFLENFRSEHFSPKRAFNITLYDVAPRCQFCVFIVFLATKTLCNNERDFVQRSANSRNRAQSQKVSQVYTVLWMFNINPSTFPQNARFLRSDVQYKLEQKRVYL